MRLTFLICLIIIILNVHCNSAIRYKSKKTYDSHGEDIRNVEHKVDENYDKKAITQRPNLDPQKVEREMQLYSELAYEKFKEETAPKKEYSDSETKSHEYSSSEHYYDNDKVDLENRRANGLEPKGFWSRENSKNMKQNKEIPLMLVNGTTEKVVLEKDRSYIDKMDQKFLKSVEGELKAFQKRFKIKDKDLVRSRRKDLKESNESVEKHVDKDNKKYIDKNVDKNLNKNVDIDEDKIKYTNMSTFKDHTRAEANYYRSVKEGVQRTPDRKRFRSKYSNENEEDVSHYRRDESIERKRHSRERHKFDTREFHELKSKGQKTKHIARSIESIPNENHNRKSSHDHKDRDDSRKTTYTHRVGKDGEKGVKDKKKQSDNSNETERQTKQEKGRSVGRQHYRNKLPKEMSIEYTDTPRRDTLSEENERYIPEENDSNYKPKTRKDDKLKKVKSNQHDSKYRRVDSEDRSYTDHKKEYLRSEKYPDVVNRRLEYPESQVPKYKRVPIDAIPRRLKSFSVERFERAQRQNQDQYFEQEINDYHNPDVLPPQVPHRKLKPIHMPSKKTSRGNEPLHTIKNQGQDAVELRDISKPGESEERVEVFKKPVVPNGTTSPRDLHRSDGEPNYVHKYIDKHPNEEVENFESVIKNTKNGEHVTKSRYEQYLQHFHDNHNDNNKNQFKNDNYESKTKSKIYENENENNEERATKKYYDRNNYYRNKKEYDNENNNFKNNNDNYNHNDNNDNKAQFLEKNYRIKKYVDKNNKFETTTDGDSYNDNLKNGQAYKNNDNYKSSNNYKNKNGNGNTESNRNNENYDKSTEKINNGNKRELQNTRTNDYYEKNSNNAYENKNYINRNNNNKDTDFKNNYDNKKYFNNNNYKNNDDNANSNNFEEHRNNNPIIQNSNYKDKLVKLDERKPIVRYEPRSPYESQAEDRFNPPAKPVTPNYQFEIVTRGIEKDYDRQPTIDSNYGNYPENYQGATPSINNKNSQRPYLGPPEEASQEPPQRDSNEKENLRNGPKIRIEEKPGYRVQYLDFRRRYRNKYNFSGTRSRMDTQSTDVNIMRNDDSNHTKSKLSKDLIRQWRKGYGNVENEKKLVETKTRRKTSKKMDLNVIGPREIAYLKEKYVLPSAGLRRSAISINTLQVREVGNHSGNSSVKPDNFTSTNKDEKIIVNKHLKRRKKKRRTKKRKNVKIDKKPQVADKVEKDDVLNLTDAIIDNKTKENDSQNQSKVSVETAIDDNVEEVKEIEEKNFTENFKNSVWSALEKSILGRYNENKTDNIMFLNMAATNHDNKTETLVSDIKTGPNHERYGSDTEISDTTRKIVTPTEITAKHNARWANTYENVNIQMLQYPIETRKFKHDKHYDDNKKTFTEEPTSKQKTSHEKIRKHGTHSGERSSGSNVHDYSKKYHNISIPKHEFYETTDKDNEKFNSIHRHQNHYNDRNKQEHFEHKNKYNGEADDAKVDSDNYANEKERKHHKSDDNIAVNHFIRSKDRIDHRNKENSHENSKSKPEKHTQHKNYENDHKTETMDQTHDKTFDNQKIYDKISVKRDFLDKYHVRHTHDNIIKKPIDEHVEYVKTKKDSKNTHFRSEHTNNSEYAKLEHNKSERDNLNNDDTRNKNANPANRKEHIVPIKKQNATDVIIVQNQINSTNCHKHEHKRDSPAVRNNSAYNNNSDPVPLRTIHLESSHESQRAWSDCDDTPEAPLNTNDTLNVKFPFIVMLVQELENKFKCLCTAVTITPNFAITAAHCIPTDSNAILHIEYEIHTKMQKSKKNCSKTHHHKTDNTNANSSRLLPDLRNSTKVLKIFEHPNYRQVYMKRDSVIEPIHSTTVNDIAILKTQNNLPLPVGKLSAFEFNSLLGVSVNFYGMENNNCTRETFADITLRQDEKKYNIQTRAGAVATCDVKAEGITLCLASECTQQVGEKLNILVGGPVIFSDRVVGIVSEIEPTITFIPVSPYLGWITQVLEQEKPDKPSIEKAFVKIL